MQPIRTLLLLLTFVSSSCLLTINAQLPGENPPPGNGTEGTPYLVNDIGHLMWIADRVNNGDELTGKIFEQTSDIDMSETEHWHSGRGWDPIGGDRLIDGGMKKVGFAGLYDGKGHTIRGLYINRPEALYQALFGYTKGDIRNLTIENASIIAKEYAGALAAYLYAATIENCHIRGGKVKATLYAGGLLGYQAWGTLLRCSADAEIEATEDYAGGLTGWNNEGQVVRCRTSGLIKGGNSLAGGLVGYQYYGSASECQSSARVIGAGSIGGLIGRVSHGSVAACFATGNVEGQQNVGGLLGRNESSKVENCYATGSVKGIEFVGGFVGYNTYSEGQISNAYSTGKVEGSAPYVGGFTGGMTGGLISKSYWQISSSNMNEGVGGVSKEDAEVFGKNEKEMKQAGTFVGWDFEKVWTVGNDFNDGYPSLRWFVSESNATKEIVKQAHQLFTKHGHRIEISEMYGVRRAILYSTSGFRVLNVASEGERPIVFSVEALDPGVYILSCQVADGSTISNKLVR